MRSDVLVKLELLDQKHGQLVKQRATTTSRSLLVQDIVFQLHRFITALDKYHKECNETMKGADIFPIEVDLTFPTLHGSNNRDDEASEEEEMKDSEEQQPVKEDFDLLNMG